jgi:hypothetical protein
MKNLSYFLLGVFLSAGLSIPNKFINYYMGHILSYNVATEQFLHSDDYHENINYSKLDQSLITVSGIDVNYQANKSSTSFIDAFSVFNG